LVVGDPLSSTNLPTTPNLFSAPIQQTSGTSVLVNAEAAPILNVSLYPTQTMVTFQVPCDVTPGSTPVSVTLGTGVFSTPGQNTATATLDVRGASPGFFEIPMSDGARRVLAVRPDGSFVSLENPAQRGEVILLFLTGIGPVSPAVNTGAVPTLGTFSQSTAAAVSLVLGDANTPVPILSPPLAAPSLLGAYELGFQVPTDAPTGNDVYLEVGVLVTDPGDYQFANPGVGTKIPIQ
jgi:uncharacterized protein (TIGR03437 family)